MAQKLKDLSEKYDQEYRDWLYQQYPHLSREYLNLVACGVFQLDDYEKKKPRS